MEKIKTYRYPIWLRIFVRIVQLIQLGILLGIAFFIMMVLITLSQWGFSLLELFIPAVLGLGFVIALSIFFLANLLSFPNVDVMGNQIRISNLFLSSSWLDIEELLKVEYKFLLLDPTGYAEKILVDTLGIYRRSLVVESDKLPWLSRWNRILVRKKGAVFIIGERIEGFDELRTLLKGKEK